MRAEEERRRLADARAREATEERQQAGIDGEVDGGPGDPIGAEIDGEANNGHGDPIDAAIDMDNELQVTIDAAYFAETQLALQDEDQTARGKANCNRK